MIGAESDDIATGVSACERDRGSVRGRAVLAELHHLRRRNQIQQRLGCLDFDQRRPREVRAELHLAVCSLDDLRIRVTERDGSKSHAVLDELVAFRIPDATAGASGDQPGRDLGKLVVTLRVRVRTAGDDGVCALA